MALITRISRLFKADFHAVLDQIEEPEVLLRQAIRDMEDSLAQAERGQCLRLDEIKKAAARRDELDRALQDIDDELDVCFESGEEDLARGLIRRKLEQQRLRKLVAARCDDLAQTSVQQQASVEEKRAQLESMRQKAELFAERTPTGGPDATGDYARSDRELRVNDNEVDVAFLREKKKRARS